jgi:hypothetical protein
MLCLLHIHSFFSFVSISRVTLFFQGCGSASVYNADPDADPAFHFNADPGLTFHFNVETDPASDHGDSNLSHTKFHFEPTLTQNPDPYPAFHLIADPDPSSKNMWIRDQAFFFVSSNLICMLS